jgi:hypothetical protein
MAMGDLKTNFFYSHTPLRHLDPGHLLPIHYETVNRGWTHLYHCILYHLPPLPCRWLSKAIPSKC